MSAESNFSNAKFLTVAEVAEVMRVSKMTVYRLVHSGEMPAVSFGRSFRVPETAVEQYLKGAVVDGHGRTTAPIPVAAAARRPLHAGSAGQGRLRISGTLLRNVLRHCKNLSVVKSVA